ncbi:hypothetical protein HDU77_003829 [Chytriomyces hyalinus]|nr:hypothetical protein HDU77_003829 [Chytriomyces hyalinus]
MGNERDGLHSRRNSATHDLLLLRPESRVSTTTNISSSFFGPTADEESLTKDSSDLRQLLTSSKVRFASAFHSVLESVQPNYLAMVHRFRSRRFGGNNGAIVLLVFFLCLLVLSNSSGYRRAQHQQQQQQPELSLPPQYDDDYNSGEARINWGPGVNGRPACNRPSEWCVIRKGWNDLETTQIAGPGKKARLRAVYYNTHGGSERNMMHVFRHFNHKSLVLDIFSPDQISGYGMTHTHARAVIDSGHVDYICNRYDLVILGDTVPHARAVLLSLLEDNPARRCQAARIIVEMTNRFDWDIQEGPDRMEYYRMLQKLVAMSRTIFKGRLLWVASNLADAKYFEFTLNMTVPEVRVLRPLGLSDVFAYPTDLPTPDPNVLAAQWHKSNVYGYLREEEKIPMALIPFGHHYGGPQNLLQFKGFIDIPYQYSTFKFYENIAAGVPLLFPTPRFLMELSQAGLHAVFIFNPTVLSVFAKNKTQSATQVYNVEWAAYMDYYLPKFEPFIYYFDTYQELYVLSNATREKLDSKNVRKAGPKFYAEFRRVIYRGWEEVLLRGYPED